MFLAWTVEAVFVLGDVTSEYAFDHASCAAAIVAASAEDRPYAIGVAVISALKFASQLL